MYVSAIYHLPVCLSIYLSSETESTSGKSGTLGDFSFSQKKRKCINTLGVFCIDLQEEISCSLGT